MQSVTLNRVNHWPRVQPWPCPNDRSHRFQDLEAFSQLRFALSEGLHLGVSDREIKSSPRRKFGRLPAGYFVCERNSVRGSRTYIGLRLVVTEHLRDLGRASKESREKLRWDLV